MNLPGVGETPTAPSVASPRLRAVANMHVERVSLWTQYVRDTLRDSARVCRDPYTRPPGWTWCMGGPQLLFLRTSSRADFARCSTPLA